MLKLINKIISDCLKVVCRVLSLLLAGLKVRAIVLYPFRGVVNIEAKVVLSQCSDTGIQGTTLVISI
ncbi:MAG: hypothetical protein LBU56_03125 [Rickettsiales bacterium]|nr:hypothetical protein [Rickettsiales bacterium]